MLGIAASLAFLVAAVRFFAFRGYASLLDAPQDTRGGRIHGTHSGRSADIGFVSSDRGSHKPGKVQLSLACTAPLRVEAYRTSLAVSLRTAIGILSDRKTGIEDLDRRFAFQFDDRSKMEALLGRPEVQQGFHALADLGADFILLTNGHLTIEIPMTFVLPPGRGRVSEALATMHTLASATESALPAAAPAPSSDLEDLWPASPTSSASVSAPTSFGVLFVAILIGVLVVGSFWDFSGRIPWQTRLDAVNARLPLVAVISGVTALFAAFLVPRKPVMWGVLVSFPLLAHAALAWVLYLVLRSVDAPEVQNAFTRELEFLPAGVKTATIAAAACLGSSLAGVFLGSRLSAKE